MAMVLSSVATGTVLGVVSLLVLSDGRSGTPAIGPGAPSGAGASDGERVGGPAPGLPLGSSAATGGLASGFAPAASPHRPATPPVAAPEEGPAEPADSTAGSPMPRTPAPAVPAAEAMAPAGAGTGGPSAAPVASVSPRRTDRGEGRAELPSPSRSVSGKRPVSRKPPGAGPGEPSTGEPRVSTGGVANAAAPLAEAVQALARTSATPISEAVPAARTNATPIGGAVPASARTDATPSGGSEPASARVDTASIAGAMPASPRRGAAAATGGASLLVSSRFAGVAVRVDSGAPRLLPAGKPTAVPVAAGRRRVAFSWEAESCAVTVELVPGESQALLVGDDGTVYRIDGTRKMPRPCE